MNNFAYRSRNHNPNQIWPYQAPTWTEVSPPIYDNKAIRNENDERFGGGFILPFLTGAVVSAPLWYIGGSNKAKQEYQQQQMYYQNPYNPMYYPYPAEGQAYPSYYPYPMYK